MVSMFLCATSLHPFLKHKKGGTTQNYSIGIFSSSHIICPRVRFAKYPPATHITSHVAFLYQKVAGVTGWQWIYDMSTVFSSHQKPNLIHLGSYVLHIKQYQQASQLMQQTHTTIYNYMMILVNCSNFRLMENVFSATHYLLGGIAVLGVLINF